MSIANAFERIHSILPDFGNILLTLYHKIRLLRTLKEMAFENIVGKGENAVNQHFLLVPQCFLPY